MKFSIFKDINLLLFLGKALNEVFSILFNAFIKNELSKFCALCANVDIKYLLFNYLLEIYILNYIYCVQILTFYLNNDNDF